MKAIKVYQGSRMCIVKAECLFTKQIKFVVLRGKNSDERKSKSD